MQITVYYKSGSHQTFIVPKDILAVEFRRIAEAVGGRIKKLKFTHSSDINSFKYRIHQ
jgi:hypothetical protein